MCIQSDQSSHLDGFWIVKDQSFLQVDSESSDMIAPMGRLIQVTQVYAGCLLSKVQFFMLLCLNCDISLASSNWNCSNKMSCIQKEVMYVFIFFARKTCSDCY